MPTKSIELISVDLCGKNPKQKHGKARIPLDSDARTHVLKKSPHGDLMDLGNPQKRPVFHYLSVFFFFSCLDSK